MQISYNFIAANLQSLLKCDSMQARDEYFRFHVFINIVKKYKAEQFWMNKIYNALSLSFTNYTMKPFTGFQSFLFW